MTNREELEDKGFTILRDLFTDTEIDAILATIRSAVSARATFRRSEDLFAIRQFLMEIPEVNRLIFTDKFKATIKNIIGDGFFVVKSIYFDKPEKSNWFVSYHQDLMISVNKRIENAAYGPWTVKQNQFAVQPPLDILNSIFTIRIHLDNTDANNGALKVIPGSHRNGICRPGTIDRAKEPETICSVTKGGIMFMRPLLFHSSGRTTSKTQRRVIHLEFSNTNLTPEIEWAEKKYD